MIDRFLRAIPRANLFPLSLIVAASLFYCFAVGYTGWYVYVALAFIVVERSIIAFVNWITVMMSKQLISSMMAYAEAQSAEEHGPPRNPTLGPIIGGTIEPNEDEEDGKD